MAPCRDPRTGWTRLEETLVGTKPGEAVTLETSVTETGLAKDTISTVMNELTRVELFEQEERNVFVRRSLWQSDPRQDMG